MIKNKFLVFFFVPIVFFALAVNAQIADEEYDEANPQLETQIVTPEGILEDVSLDEESDVQNENIEPNVVEGVDGENITQKETETQKINIKSQYDKDVFAAVNLSLKNLSEQSRKELKEEVRFLDELEIVLKNSDNVQANIDSAFADVEKRGAVATFFFGQKYSALKKIKLKSVDVENISKQAFDLSKMMKSDQLSDMLKVFSFQLSAKSVENEEKVKQFESKKSLLGWLLKAFV